MGIGSWCNCWFYLCYCWFYLCYSMCLKISRRGGVEGDKGQILSCRALSVSSSLDLCVCLSWHLPPSSLPRHHPFCLPSPVSPPTHLTYHICDCGREQAISEKLFHLQPLVLECSLEPSQASLLFSWIRPLRW